MTNGNIKRLRMDFGKIQASNEKAATPLDKASTLETLENFLLYTKRYSMVNRKAIMGVASYLLNHYDLSVIDADKAREVEEDLRAKGLKPRSINRKLDSLEFIAECMGKPIKIKKIKVCREVKIGLTLLECRALLQGCNSVRDRALISLMLTTGARAKEILGANVDDIDLKNRYFIIRPNSSEAIVKNYREHKAILTKECAQILKEWIDLRGDLDDKALFVNQWRRRLSKSGLEKIVSAIAKRAGIEKHVYPHLLRAACATQLLRSGVALNDVARQLNHTSILSTMVYLTSDTESLRDSIDKKFVL